MNGCELTDQNLLGGVNGGRGILQGSKKNQQNVVNTQTEAVIKDNSLSVKYKCKI